MDYNILPKEYSNEAIAERVLNRRKELNLTQKELAEKACVSEPTVRKLEKGLHKPSIATLKKIAEALSVSWFYLKFGSDLPSDEDLISHYTTLQNKTMPVINDELRQVATAPIMPHFFNDLDIIEMGNTFFDRLEMVENTHTRGDIERKEIMETYIVMKLPHLTEAFITLDIKFIETGVYVVYDRHLQLFYPARFKVQEDRLAVKVFNLDGIEQATVPPDSLDSTSSDLFIYGELKLSIRQYI